MTYSISRAATAVLAVLAIAGSVLVSSAPAVAASAPKIAGCVGAQALDPASPDECRLQETYAALKPVKGLATATAPVAASRACRVPSGGRGVPVCVFGVSSSTVLKVAIVGDSHAEQWVPALDAIADREKWRVETYLKGGCPFSTVMRTGLTKAVRDSCKSWNAAVVKKLVAGKFDLILTTHASGRPFARATGETSIEAEARGVRSQLAAVAKRTDAQIIAIRDSPVLRIDPRSCLDALGSRVFGRSDRCSSERTASLRPDASSLAAESTDRSVIDLSDYFCNESKCFGMVGAVRVYRDSSHLSGLYVKTLTPYFDAALTSALALP